MLHTRSKGIFPTEIGSALPACQSLASWRTSALVPALALALVLVLVLGLGPRTGRKSRIGQDSCAFRTVSFALGLLHFFGSKHYTQPGTDRALHHKVRSGNSSTPWGALRTVQAGLAVVRD